MPTSNSKKASSRNLWKAEEKDIQAGIIEWLLWHGWQAWAIRERVPIPEMNIAAGTAGIPDVVAIKRGRGTIFFEVKTEDGTCSEAQLAWHCAYREQGGEVHVVRSTEDVERAIANPLPALEEQSAEIARIQSKRRNK